MSLRRYSYGLITVIALGIFTQALPVSAYTVSTITAEEHGDFVLEPGKMEIIVEPGETVTKTISVTNRINRDVDFKVEIEDFIGSRDPQSPVTLLGDDKSPYSFKDNLKPELDSFNLKFGQRIAIPVEISVPADAQPGGYYASVLISNEPSKTATGTIEQTAGRTRIVSRLGVLFFIRVKGPTHEEGQVQDFRVKGPQNLFYSKSPDGFDILFENTGTVHLVPYGLITIKNTLGKGVKTLPVDAYFSLPNSLRYRTIAWNDAGFRLGRYTATLELNRGYGDVIDTKQIVFWVIPWKILIGIVVTLVIIFSLMYFIGSKFEFRRKQ